MFRPFQLMGEHVVAFLPLEGQAQAVRVEDREASGFRTIGAILVTNWTSIRLHLRCFSPSTLPSYPYPPRCLFGDRRRGCPIGRTGYGEVGRRPA